MKKYRKYYVTYRVVLTFLKSRNAWVDKKNCGIYNSITLIPLLWMFSDGPECL